MKRCSTSLISREMQIKTINTMRLSPHTSQNGHHQKNLHTVNAREGVEKREPSYTVGGNVNWYSHYGEQYGISLKTKARTTLSPSNPTPALTPRQNHNYKRLHAPQYSLQHYLQKPRHGGQEETGTTEDEIDGWMASLTQWTWVWVDSGSW